MRDKYLDLPKELKKLWNTKVTSVIVTFWMVSKGLKSGLEELEIQGRTKTIQATALLKSARILSPGDLRRLPLTHSSERPPANAGVWPRLSDPFVSQNSCGVCASHSPREMLACANTIFSCGQIHISGTVPCGSPFPPNSVLFYTLFALVYCIHLICDSSFRLYHHIM